MNREQREQWISQRVKSGREDLLVVDVSHQPISDPRKLCKQTDLPSNWDKVTREDGIRTPYDFNEWKAKQVTNGNWEEWR